jgi:acyl-CoA synthetase (AMP-forming)/AMP-acid ligase II
MARAMLDLGLEKGDRIAAFAPNCAEYIDFFFACAKAGVIGAALNIRLAPAELASYLNYVEPKAILVHAGLGEAADKFLSEVGSIEHVIGIGQDHGRSIDLAEARAAQPDTDPGVAVADDEPYQLGATSGTTGVPKGAVLTHRNAIAAMLNWMAEVPYPEGATNLQNIPLFFNPGGPAGLNPALVKGGRSVIFPAFEPGNFLRAVAEYRVTHSILVPTMVGMVLNHEECGQHDLSSLQGIFCGGSPLPREVLARAREVMGDVFYPLYGMAETYSNGLILRRENQYTEGTEAQVRRLASAGKPNVLMQVRVVDVEGNDVPRDNTTGGEIWMKGDTVSPEYFRMPEETASSRQDGWFKSGDVATVDEEGFITIVDRMKDIIITGGINVFSRDVEEALYAHPAVVQAAVIGVPHEQWGEAIHGVVVLAPGKEATPEELIAFATERLADYKKPRSVEIVDALPIGGTGKILKKELREPYWAETGRKV